MVRSLTVFALVLTVQVLSAQSRPIFRGSQVQRLVSVSSPEFEAKPDISHDRLTLYFASAQPGGAGELDLWVATRPDLSSPFGAPSNIQPLNSSGRDHTPTTSADGLLMIFSSNRDGGLGTDDAWMTTRPTTASPWGPPIHIPELSSSARDMGFSMTPDGLVIYFTSNRSDPNAFDLYTSRRSSLGSPWSPPVPILELNTPWEDKFPSVTGDDLTLYFASNRPGSVKSNLGVPTRDIWVAMRPTPQSPWSAVENVSEINTGFSEYLMSISDDGEELFFAADLPGSQGILDLYHVQSIPATTRYGVGTRGEAGTPRLEPIGGDPRAGNSNWGIRISDVSPTALGAVVFGPSTAPGPILVGLNDAYTTVVFQQAVFHNPPADQPRTIPIPLPNDPTIVGFTAYIQAVMLWDLQGSGSISSIPFAASPGLHVSVIR